MSIAFQTTRTRLDPHMGLLRRVTALMSEFVERRRIASQYKHVEHLSDHLLKDIGLRREYSPNGWSFVRISRD